MAYSSIKRKRCKCSENCKMYPTLGYSGFYSKHASEEIKLAAGNRRKVAQKNKRARLYASNKIRSQERAENGENELELWFRLKMQTEQPKCYNCGVEAYGLKNNPANKFLWRSCQAHLLPKCNFKSIQSHPLNGIVLGSGISGMCNCHDQYDSNWLKASKMNIWGLVVERFKILYPLIKESEHQFIPQILLDTL